MKNYFINVNRRWSAESIRNTCIRHGLYTRGTCEEYDRVLDWVSRINPSLENMVEIAVDIVNHSEDRTIEDVMAILENEAVRTSFEISE